MILWLMCGAPGCGKTYFANNVLCTDPKIKYISRDKIRFVVLEEGDEYFSKEEDVFRIFVSSINNAIRNNLYSQVIVDATHLNTRSRMKLLKQITKKESLNIIPVWFNTPLDICLQRNAKREGRACVPETALINMYNSRQHPSEDNFPYAAILEVN